MTRNIANFTISGIVSSEPQNKAVAGQKSRVSLGVFVNNDEKPSHYFITFWGHTAEFIEQYIKKGDFVVIQGRLESYKKDETSFEITQLIGERIDPSPYSKNKE